VFSPFADAKEESEMAMTYDKESRTLVLTGRDGKVVTLRVLLLNRCTCGAVLRAYVELPSAAGLNLADFLPWREAARYETRREGRFMVLFPRAYVDESSRCCRREKLLAFGLEPMVERWLKQRSVEPDSQVVAQVRDVLLANEVPGFGLIRDEMSGEAMGFTWLERAVYGGDRYWTDRVCAACFEAVYPGETACRACGSTDLMSVETETWGQFDQRRKERWANLWRVLGLANPTDSR